jgi:2-(1,2-epoxy-1,2-dihydrophenyl)acetyl-CoA isomerase
MADHGDPVELVRALYRALAAGDRAALDTLLDADFVGDTASGMPLGLGGRFAGAAAMRREFWGPIAREFEVAAHADEIVQLPDGRVLVTGCYLGIARATGRKLEAAFSHTIAVADGRITGLRQLTDTARWVEALVPATGSTVSTEPAESSEPVEHAAGRPPLSALQLELGGPIGRLRLCRPDAANSIDAALARDLLTAAATCATDPTMRVLVLSADGPAFCPGGDLAALSATPPAELPALLDRMLTEYHQALRLFLDLEVPIVAAVHGSAGGGGLGLLHVADIVIAGSDAKFAVGSGALGLGADGGNSWFLPRLVGRRTAAQMCYSNRVLTAAEALACGLVSEVVPAGEVADRAEAIAARIAAGPRESNAALRELLRPAGGLSDALDAERQGMVELARSPAVVGRMRAFLNRVGPESCGA